jgi:hypothetical protein
MKKLAVFVFLFAFTLWAADFWTKPYTDWTDKEVQKIGNSSPWAKEFNVALGGGGGAPGGGSGKRGGGGGGQNNPASANAEDPGGLGGGGAGTSLTLYIRWQSALPVKQAVARVKYGAQVGSSPDAKQYLATEEPNYVIVIDGLNRGMIGASDADAMKKTLLDQTALVIKGKEPIKAIDFRLVGQGRISAVFAFPKTNPIDVDDKEVEFQTKLGMLSIRQRFRLKEMMINGKLEL